MFNVSGEVALVGKKFHVAMYCSEEAFAERREFYSAIFGAASSEGPINEGSGGHSFEGCMWKKQDGLIFALLRKPDLSGHSEQLAHVGFIFDNEAEFDAEIQRRGINPRRVSVLSEGQKQVFECLEIGTGVEWEFSCDSSS